MRYCTYLRVFSSIFSAFFLSTNCTNNLGIKREGPSRSALFRRITTNKILDVTPIATYSNKKMGECALVCIRLTSCAAYNFRSATGECHLLDVDRNTMADGNTFVTQTGWAYYDSGFDIRHANWRKKSLLNVTCTENHCGRCQCLHPLEESWHCDCYSGEGVIIVGSLCWKPVSGCNAVDNNQIWMVNDCDVANDDHKFMFNAETGDIIHKCSGKRVCTKDGSTNNGAELVVSSNCPSLQDNNRWMLTDSGTLQYGGKCIHAHQASVSPNDYLVIYNGCMSGAQHTEHRFAARINGRVHVKLFTDLGSGSLTQLTSNSNFPNNPAHVAWYHNLDAPTYADEMEHFGRQMRTYFVSPESGIHIFYMTVDDFAELYFGLSEATKTKIIGLYRAQEINKYYVNKLYNQYSPVQNLKAGQKYYLEVLMYEDAGVDYVSVGVKFPSGKGVFPITERYLVAPE